ncbi:MAG TPA: hypothetical protein VFI19_07935 [Nocardioides sp.]|nr:hypothetical protein [Nocardioides sp.]
MVASGQPPGDHQGDWLRPVHSHVEMARIRYSRRSHRSLPSPEHNGSSCRVASAVEATSLRPMGGLTMESKLVAVALGGAALTLALASTASADPLGTGAGGAPSSQATSEKPVTAPKAGTSTTIGQVATNLTTTSCAPLAGVQQAVAGPPAYTTAAGVVTRFSYNANAVAGTVRALFWRPSTTPGNWTLVAKSPLMAVTPSTLNNFAVRVPVPAGVVMGIQTTVSGMNCGGPGLSAADVVAYSTAFNPDTSTEMTPTGSSASIRWNISAVVESDADGDGFGDVTQDACPESSTTQAACPAPNVIIKKKPAKTSHNRFVKITFKSTVPGSTFKCSLDGKKFKACSSPYEKRLGFGNHKVKIQAFNPAGIADPTPAKVEFRINP